MSDPHTNWPPPAPDLLGALPAHLLLDALPTPTAILDVRGVIQATNAAWRDIATGNSLAGAACPTGIDYIVFCRALPIPAGAHVAGAVERVVRGEAARLSVDYEAGGDGALPWYTATAVALGGEAERGVLLTHQQHHPAPAEAAPAARGEAETRGALAVEPPANESEARYRMIFDNAPIALWEEDFSPMMAHLSALRVAGVTDLRAHFDAHPEEVYRCVGLVRIVDMNATTLTLYQAPSREALFASLHLVAGEGTYEAHKESILAAADGASQFARDVVNRTLAGDDINISLRWAVVPGYETTYAKVLVSIIDISALKRAEAAVETSRAQLAGIIDSAMDAIITVDADQRVVLFNAAAERLFGCPAADALGQPLEHFIPERFHAAHRRHVRGFVATHATSRAMGRLGALAGRRVTGEEFPIEASISQVTIGGETLATVILRDISERERIVAALHESEARFRQLAEHIEAVFWLTNPANTEVYYVSPAYERIWGRSCASLCADPASFLEPVHPDDLPQVLAAVERQQRDGMNLEYRIVRPDGTVAWILDQSFPIRAPDGTVIRIAGVATDVTAQRQLEEQLRHAQKLESVGRLAGGVAHDFNNLLTVILGYVDLLDLSLGPGHPQQDDLEQIRRAGMQASGLTRQLLAFARKQIVEPRVLDLNLLIEETAALLRRLVGEDVQLTTLLAPSLGRVMIDHGQLQQVLMNLAVNARDAMPLGGKLTIETRNVQLDREYVQLHATVSAGPYVMIAVTDTGSGIAPETLPHIFEPFYTTKERGQGTGLGLAVCHGIVTQAGGHLWVYSELGHGTSIRVYLPQTDVALTPSEPRQPEPEHLHGQETILLVEDEPLIRELVVAALTPLGYTVLVAPHGAAALERASSYPGVIHVLVTDVILPDTSGKQFAEYLLGLRPALAVLYISGYTEDAIVHHGVLEPGVAFLAKPFTPRALAQRVRRLLDRSI